ncbi:MAG TPA: pilin [Candidatus Moranbacteria bacterium]|nr:pilin [Candidatus Moranbacteria bacterium]
MFSKKSFFATIIILLFLFLPLALINAQGVVPCGHGDDPNNACTLCHLIIGIKKIIDFGLKLLVVVAFIGIFIAGIMYIISSGSEEMMKRAKAFLTASLTGFAITLGAWLIVNIVIWSLSANPTIGIKGANWYTFTCSTKSSAANPAVTTPSAPSAPSTPNAPSAPGGGGTASGYTYDPGIQSQASDASGDLTQLLNCMQPKLPTEAKRISSISDSHGMENCAGTAWESSCAHTKDSCHYGGKNSSCIGKSYAADFGNESYSNQIISTARSCGANYAVMEGNHVHVSVGASCGCN